MVPDDYNGEWGGAPVCPRCYWIERGLHSANPGAFLAFAAIAKISKCYREVPA